MDLALIRQEILFVHVLKVLKLDYIQRAANSNSQIFVCISSHLASVIGIDKRLTYIKGESSKFQVLAGYIVTDTQGFPLMATPAIYNQILGLFLLIVTYRL